MLNPSAEPRKMPAARAPKELGSAAAGATAA
jgi:hypothetical protein